MYLVKSLSLQFISPLQLYFLKNNQLLILMNTPCIASLKLANDIRFESLFKGLTQVCDEWKY